MIRILVVLVLLLLAGPARADLTIPNMPNNPSPAVTDAIPVTPGLGTTYKESAGTIANLSTLSGDVTKSPGSTVSTLATVLGSPGSCTNCNLTINAKGLVTAQTNGTGGSGGGLSLTGTVTTGNLLILSTASLITNGQLSGDVTTAGGTTTTLATVLGSPGSCTNCNLTINGKGLVTAQSTGSGGTGVGPFQAASAASGGPTAYTIAGSAFVGGTPPNLTAGQLYFIRFPATINTGDSTLAIAGQTPYHIKKNVAGVQSLLVGGELLSGSPLGLQVDPTNSWLDLLGPAVGQTITETTSDTAGQINFALGTNYIFTASGSLNLPAISSISPSEMVTVMGVSGATVSLVPNGSNAICGSATSCGAGGATLVMSTGVQGFLQNDGVRWYTPSTGGSSGGSGTVTSGASENGTAAVFDATNSTSSQLKFNGITAGSNVTVTGGGNNTAITISATGGGGGTVIPLARGGLATAWNSATSMQIGTGTAADSAAATYISLASKFYKSVSGAWTAGAGSSGSPVNGMGNGLTVANNTWYFVCLATVSAASDVYFDTSYQCNHPPSGTTAARPIWFFKTNGSAQIIHDYQNGNKFMFATWTQDWNGSFNTIPATIAFTGGTAGTTSIPTGLKVRPILVVDSPNAATNWCDPDDGTCPTPGSMNGGGGSYQYVSAFAVANVMPAIVTTDSAGHMILVQSAAGVGYEYTAGFEYPWELN